MIQLYGQGFDRASLEGFKDNIHGNVIQGITTLAQQSELIGERVASCRACAHWFACRWLSNQERCCHVERAVHQGGRCAAGAAIDTRFAVFFHSGFLLTALVLADIAKHVTALWADAGIQKAFTEHRAKFQIPDSAGVCLALLFAGFADRAAVHRLFL